jgi:hypothetical protein
MIGQLILMSDGSRKIHPIVHLHLNVPQKLTNRVTGYNNVKYINDKNEEEGNTTRPKSILNLNM